MAGFKSHADRARIEELLTARKARLADVDVLQPAEPFLDTAGDELRRRIFMARGIDGRNVCLRPEFTIPVCLAFLEGGNGPIRQAYVGEVFRQARAEGMEFLQAGIEDLGNPDRISADVRIIEDALACLSDLAAGVPLSLTLGDQSVFDAVLRALELPLGWRIRLVDAFGDEEAMATQLKALTAPTDSPDLPAHISHLLSGDLKLLEAAIAEDMATAGLPHIGGRTAAEIAGRLRARTEQADHAAPPASIAQLEAFLSINVPLAEAVSALSGFADAAAINLEDAIIAFDARVQAIGKAGLDLDAMQYAASFGRSLDYYTGMVFEIRDERGAVLVGGGRYDRLLEMLGASEPVPGVGFSIWLDRLGGGAS